MNQKEKIKWYHYVGFTVVFLALVLVVYMGVRHVYSQKHNTQIASLERQIDALRSSINVDSIRQYNIQKIIAIIDQYNVTMLTHQKYEIAEEIFRMTQKYSNLNADLICATITHETAGTWRPDIVSPVGAMGLMQIMPATGMFVAASEGIQWTQSEEILFDPIYNIRIGARYLSSLIELYDVDGGLAAYNGGEKRASLWIGSGKASGVLAAETQAYIPAIQRLYNEFQDFRL
jgi:soluble lytic murein transglycosylase-like protein